MEGGLPCEPSEGGGGGSWVGTVPPFDVRNFQRDRQLLFVRTKYERVILLLALLLFFSGSFVRNIKKFLVLKEDLCVRKSESLFSGYHESYIPTFILVYSHFKKRNSAT